MKKYIVMFIILSFVSVNMDAQEAEFVQMDQVSPGFESFMQQRHDGSDEFDNVAMFEDMSKFEEHMDHIRQKYKKERDVLDFDYQKKLDEPKPKRGWLVSIQDYLLGKPKVDTVERLNKEYEEQISKLDRLYRQELHTTILNYLDFVFKKLLAVKDEKVSSDMSSEDVLNLYKRKKDKVDDLVRTFAQIQKDPAYQDAIKVDMKSDREFKRLYGNDAEVARDIIHHALLDYLDTLFKKLAVIEDEKVDEDSSSAHTPIDIYRKQKSKVQEILDEFKEIEKDPVYQEAIKSGFRSNREFKNMYGEESRVGKDITHDAILDSLDTLFEKLVAIQKGKPEVDPSSNQSALDMYKKQEAQVKEVLDEFKEIEKDRDYQKVIDHAVEKGDRKFADMYGRESILASGIMHREILDYLDAIFAKLVTLQNKKPGTQMLGLSSEPTTKEEVIDAYRKQEAHVKDVLDEFKEVKKDKDYKQVVEHAIAKGEREFHDMYFKESELVSNILNRLEDSKEYFLKKLHKKDQVTDILAEKNPYRLLDVTASVSSDDVQKAYDKKVEELQKDRQLHDNAELMKEAKDHIAHALEQINRFNAQKQRLEGYKKRNAWQMLDLEKDNLSMVDVQKAYRLKMDDLDAMLKDLDNTVPEVADLRSLIEKEKKNIESARTVLAAKIKDRVDHVLQAVKEPVTVDSDKKVLSFKLDKTSPKSAQETVQSSYDNVLKLVQDADKLIPKEKVKHVIDRIKEARSNLWYKFAQPKVLRDIKGLSNWQLIGLENPSSSMVDIKRVYEEKIQDLNDQLAIYKDLPTSQDEQAAVEKEMKEVDRAYDIISKRLGERIEEIKRHGSDPSPKADRRLLDLGIAVDPNNIKHAYRKTLAELQGAGDLIAESKHARLYERIKTAKDRLLSSIDTRFTSHAKMATDNKEVKIEKKQRKRGISEDLKQTLTSEEEAEIQRIITSVQVPEDIFEHDESLQRFTEQVMDSVIGNSALNEMLQEPKVQHELEEEFDQLDSKHQKLIRNRIKLVLQGISEDRILSTVSEGMMVSIYGGIVALAIGG